MPEIEVGCNEIMRVHAHTHAPIKPVRVFPALVRVNSSTHAHTHTHTHTQPGVDDLEDAAAAMMFGGGDY